MIDIETQTYHTMLSNCCVSERILKVWKRGSLLYERLWGSCEAFFKVILGIVVGFSNLK